MPLSDETAREIASTMQFILRTSGLDYTALTQELAPLGVTGLIILGSHYYTKLQFIAEGTRTIFTIREDNSVLPYDLTGT